MLDCEHFAAQHLNIQTLLTAWAFALPENEKLAMSTYSGAEEAKASVMQYIRGALCLGGDDEEESRADDMMAWWRSSGKNTVRIFTMIGQMGTGKTRLQYELCKQVAVKTDFGSTHVNFVRLPHNEGFQWKTIPGGSMTIFGQNLLVCCGMGADAAQGVRSFEEAIELLYRKLTWPADKGQALAVCIEFQALPVRTTDCLDLLRDLMRFQQRSCAEGKNRVVFLFAAVTAEMVRAAATPRQVCVHEVPTLDKELALSTLWELRPDLETRYNGGEDPQFEQLVHLCLPKPRALFEGIPEAYPKDVLSVSLTAAFSVVQRSNSPWAEFLHLHLTQEDVRSWLAHKLLSGDDEHKYKQKLRGVTTADGTVLDPLTLRVWCEANWKSSQVARSLREAYQADTNVQEHYEKVVEKVLYNFEAAKRVSYNGDVFALGVYYTGGSINKKLKAEFVRAFPTPYPPETLVECVPSFAPEFSRDVLGSLQTGHIVYSASHNEKGIEYLVPFFESESHRLTYVAAVQVKFSLNRNLGGGYETICTNIMELPIVKYLDEQNVTCFPVLFSTSKGDMADKSVKHGVLYNEASLFQFTECLGPLRLHREASKNQTDMLCRKAVNGMRTCVHVVSGLASNRSHHRHTHEQGLDRCATTDTCFQAATMSTADTNPKSKRNKTKATQV